MEAMQKFGLKISRVQIRIILFATYIIIAPLFVIIQKFKLKDKQTGWARWKFKSNTLNDLKRQF